MRTDISSAVTRKMQAVLQRALLIWRAPQSGARRHRSERTGENGDARQESIRSFTERREELRDRLPKIWG